MRNEENSPNMGELLFRIFGVLTLMIGLMWAGITGHMIYCQKMAPLLRIGELEPGAFRVLSELLVLGLVVMWLTHSLDPKPPVPKD